MSPKDHRHPEWEAQWRDTMADYQSPPAMEEDWASMSALLDGGGVAPPDPTPGASAGGATSWGLLQWLLPLVVVSSMATAYWFIAAEQDLATAVEQIPAATEELPTEVDNPMASTTPILPTAVLAGGGANEAVATEGAGFPAGQSRQTSGKNPASRARAQGATTTGQMEDIIGVGTVPLDKPAENDLPSQEEESTAAEEQMAENTSAPVRERATEKTVTEPGTEASRRRYRRIQRRMPSLPREYDTEKIWRAKIERQIANLRVKPKRQPKAENGLYPRARVRY